MNFMDRAIELASSAAGGVSPRPPVGAVVVSEDGETIVGEGATQPGKGPHAEQVALKSAGAKARGGSIYTTLEPHHFDGTTPACTDAIIEAGIRSIVCPVADPNPKVDGRGFEQLSKAGVEVVNKVQEEQYRSADELVEGFAKHVRTGLPFVTVKWAMSLDGKVATRSGESKWITGKAARAHAHRLRYRSDALVTGIGTVLTDDPRMTARDPITDARLENRPRWRVIVDSKSRMTQDAALLNEDGAVIHAIAAGNGLASRCEVAFLPDLNGKVDIAELVKMLGDLGCTNVLVEAGPKLTTSMLRVGVVDKIAVYISTSKIIGGSDALSPLTGEGPESMLDVTCLRNSHIETLSEDLLVTAYLKRD